MALNAIFSNFSNMITRQVSSAPIYCLSFNFLIDASQSLILSQGQVHSEATNIVDHKVEMGFLYFNAFTVSYPPTAANMNGPQLLTSNFTVNTSTQNLAFRLVSTDDSISIQLYAVAAVNVGFMMNTYYMGCLFYM